MALPRIATLAVTGALSIGLVAAAALGVGLLTAAFVFGYLALVYGGAYAVARLRGGDGDIVAIITGREDERQREIDRTAGSFSALTALALCALGAMVSLARGDGSGGPFALVLLASGAVYIVSLFVLRARV